MNSHYAGNFSPIDITTRRVVAQIAHELDIGASGGEHGLQVVELIVVAVVLGFCVKLIIFANIQKKKMNK